MKICRLTSQQLLACAGILSEVEAVLERETALAYREGMAYAKQQGLLNKLQRVLLEKCTARNKTLVETRQAFIAATNQLAVLSKNREQQIHHRKHLEAAIIDQFCELAQ